MDHLAMAKDLVSGPLAKTDNLGSLDSQAYVITLQAIAHALIAIAERLEPALIAKAILDAPLHPTTPAIADRNEPDAEAP